MFPVIAYESTQEAEKKSGFLGLFKKKDKPQSTTTTKLYTLNRDVIKKQSEQSRQLSETADSLAHRNYVINQQLKDLIAAMDGRVTEDLQAREQQIIKTRERTKVYLGGITAFIFIALIASYFVIMRDYGKKERGRRKLEESNRKTLSYLKCVIRLSLPSHMIYEVRSTTLSVIQIWPWTHGRRRNAICN